MRDGPIMTKSIDFSIEIIKYYRILVNKKEFDIAGQLLRSGTSIGAKVFEAQFAESRTDFIHKMKIASKEASETYYWLILCEKLKEFKVEQKAISDIKEIIAILSKIIITSKKNQL